MEIGARTGETEADQRLRWAFLGLPLALFAAGIHPIANYDVWRHLATGRLIWANGAIPDGDVLSFTKQGARWLEFEWLYQLVAYGVQQVGGLGLLTVVHAAAGGLALWMALRVARGHAGIEASMCAGLLGVFLLGVRMVDRPHVIVLPLSLGFVACLEGVRREQLPDRARWLLVPLQALWVNLSPTFVLGLLTAGAYLLDELWRDRQSARPARLAASKLRRHLLFLVSLAAATLANPYGYQVYASLVEHWNDPGRLQISEWISPFSSAFPLVGIKLGVAVNLVLVGVGLVVSRQARPVAIVLLFLWSAFSTTRSVRFLDQLATLGLPCTAWAIQQIVVAVRARAPAWGRWLATTRPHRSAAWLVLSLIALWAVAGGWYHASMGSVTRLGLGIDPSVVPVYAARVIDHPSMPEHIANAYEDGGFLEWAAPSRKVFQDGRSTLFSQDVFVPYRLAANGDVAEWDALVERYGLAASLINLLTPEGMLFASGLLRDEQWAPAYFDGTHALFLKSDFRAPDLAPWLRDQQQIAEDRIRDERRALSPRSPWLGWLAPRPLPRRLLAAALFYRDAGQIDQAMGILRDLERAYPSDRVVRHHLRILEER